MSTTFSPPLLGSIFRATKAQPVFEHAVENDEHEMSHCESRVFHPAVALAVETAAKKTESCLRVAAQAHCTKAVRK
jgi:hypothetical protein